MMCQTGCRTGRCMQTPVLRGQRVRRQKRSIGSIVIKTTTHDCRKKTIIRVGKTTVQRVGNIIMMCQTGCRTGRCMQTPLLRGQRVRRQKRSIRSIVNRTTTHDCREKTIIGVERTTGGAPNAKTINTVQQLHTIDFQ